MSLLIPPPRTALFPYTTLFRSLEIRFDLQGWRVSLRWRVSGKKQRPRTSSAVERQLFFPALHHERDHFARRNRLGPVRDRKSTRLNSSHPSISYAVFCLKKKT